MMESSQETIDKPIDRQSTMSSHDSDECRSTTPTPVLCNGNGTNESLDNENNNADSLIDGNIDEGQEQHSRLSPPVSDCTEPADGVADYTSDAKHEQEMATVSRADLESVATNGHPFDLNSHSSSGKLYLSRLSISSPSGSTIVKLP